MHWFEGGISEAVTSAKSENAVFVVFVEGPDRTSENTAAIINSVEVSSRLESNDFVAIKLSSGSQLYTQFAQIYQIVPVPSIFFIGGNGVPMEVVAEQISVPDLVKRIDNVLEKHRNAKCVTPAPTTTEVASPPPRPSSATSAPEGRIEAARSIHEPSTSLNTASSSGNAAQVVCSDGKCELVSSKNKEERIERAKELLEKKRAEKQKEEEEKEREKELERRKMGQDVQKLRRWQQEQEMKRLLEDRQREKAEADAARERVRKQIEEDKAERAARFSAVRKQEQEAKERAVKQAADLQQSLQTQSDVARIQFRLPDGTTNSHQFAASSTLAEVRRHVVNNVPLPCRGFTLSTTFPRRDLTPSDDTTTLQDLQLTPTAVILVVPVGVQSAPATSLDMTVVKRFMWTLIAPVLSIITYVRGLIFGHTNAEGTTQPAADDSYVQPQASTSQQNLRRRNIRESTIRREGNVHRLSNQQDSSDDENNTWNGNSTQQM